MVDYFLHFRFRFCLLIYVWYWGWRHPDLARVMGILSC